MKKAKTYYIEFHSKESGWERYGYPFTNKKEALENLEQILKESTQKNEKYRLVCEVVNVTIKILKTGKKL